MGRFCDQKQFLIFVVLLTITSPYLWTAYGDAGKTAADEPQQAAATKASLGQRLMSMALEMHKSSQGPIGKFKSLVYRVQEKIFPPSVDFNSKEAASKVSGGASNVKDAVQKSFKAGEATIEETAESASKVMGSTAQKTKETAQKTKEKVKEKVTGDASPKTKGKHTKDEL